MRDREKLREKWIRRTARRTALRRLARSYRVFFTVVMNPRIASAGAYARAWRARNAEWVREYKRRYKNSDTALAAHRRRCKEDSVYRLQCKKAANKRKRENSREKRRQWQLRYRDRLRKNAIFMRNKRRLGLRTEDAVKKRERTRAAYWKNRTAILARKREYHQKNKDRIHARKRISDARYNRIDYQIDRLLAGLDSMLVELQRQPGGENYADTERHSSNA